MTLHLHGTAHEPVPENLQNVSYAKVHTAYTKENMLRESKRPILVLAKKLNSTSSSTLPMTLMCLGISRWRRNTGIPYQFAYSKDHLEKI